ncbi:MAG TPA: hypothetical protein VFG43_10495, partial [Geminicoccaceae bacterium]|nr:hypothetical protein [Geminicoccaceae bacterium]
MTEQKNLILAIVLSIGIILAFQYFYELPRLKDAQERAQQQPGTVTQTTPAPATPAPAPGAGTAVPG